MPDAELHGADHGVAPNHEAAPHAAAAPRDWLGHAGQVVAIICGFIVVQTYLNNGRDAGYAAQTAARDQVAQLQGTVAVHTAAISQLQSAGITTDRKLDEINKALTEALTRLDDLKAAATPGRK